MLIAPLPLTLIILAGIIAFLSLAGAHSTPLPNIGKVGCLGAVGALVAGVALGVGPSINKYTDCRTTCDLMVDDKAADTPGDDTFGQVGREDYRSCVRGAKEAIAKNAEMKEIDPNLPQYEMETPEALEARCRGIGETACAMMCFEPPTMQTLAEKEAAVQTEEKEEAAKE